MTDNFRWRYGETNPVVLQVAAETEIAIGDLVYIDGGEALPASAQSDEGSLGDNQAVFHTTFAGVAMQRSPAGDARPIRVATTGVFEFDCASAAFEVGDFVGAVEAANGTELLNQSVAAVGSVSSAIGRCAKRVNPAATRVLVDIVSTLAHGGPQAAE